jgi:uncharacterized caspase-like protein
MPPRRSSRRHGRPALIAALAAMFLAAGLSAAEAARLALVVGNAAYTTAPALRNARRDAEDMAAALTRLGFDVTLLTDVGGADFWAQVDAFAARAQTAEATVFFYSGHAFQMNGTNYLVPVDATLASREALRAETWNLDGIIARLQDRKRQTLVFLDACRNDPLPAAVRGSGGVDGLARLQTGVGTFVAFATEPGAVTYDGAGDAPNSPFTAALLAAIETPGLSISDMMIEVRNRVSETTLGRQTPWDQSSLREQFYFAAPQEQKQELSEADYELLAQLSPEDRAKFLDLLRQSGFSEESLAEADNAIAIAQANLEIVAQEATLVTAATDAVTDVAQLTPAADLASLEVLEDGGAVVEGMEPATQTAEPGPEPGPQPQPRPEQVAALEPGPEPRPEDVATAETGPEPGPEPQPEQVAALEPAPALPGAAETVPPEGSTVAAVPQTAIAALPPAETPPATAAGLPLRLAALSWETRDVTALFAAGEGRARVAGTPITPDSDRNREILAAIDPALLSDAPLVIDTATLARDIQAELKRVGCYLLAVDGAWGRGSRTALTSYYLARKQVPDSLEPTPALLEQLRGESKVVCEVRVARAVVPGKTKAILPQKAAAAAGDTVVKKPKAGRKANTVTETKKEIKKGLLNSGSF